MRPFSLAKRISSSFLVSSGGTDFSDTHKQETRREAGSLVHSGSEGYAAAFLRIHPSAPRAEPKSQNAGAIGTTAVVASWRTSKYTPRFELSGSSSSVTAL